MIVTNEIDDTIELSRGRMLWLSRMKSLELLTWPLVVCCDCYRWRCRQGTWTYVVFVTNEIFGAVEMGPGGMLWLSSWRCWQGTWAYVVIVFDDAVDRAHGRMLWLSLIKSMALLNRHIDWGFDCHQRGKWKARNSLPWNEQLTTTCKKVLCCRFFICMGCGFLMKRIV